ncbi:patatin-like phospholipase family protein [Klebsiella pneumoniae]|uniref:patatin-like phospholipase family protein n=1 Tax=Klebsiella pneumoniae TaxID=573 RepID=UPI0039851301
MKKINCYAVFEGGGIKGVAFAGALQKAEEAGLNFIGYAGASAGAIIAFLAALGYSGYDIYKIINKVDFKSLLNEPTPDELKNLNSILKKAKGNRLVQ